MAGQGEVDGAVGQRQQQRGQPLGVSGTGLVRCAALGYARAGIRVNAIAPGPTRSEMFDRWMPTDEARAAMAGHFPLNYIADPDDMARAALFLLSDESRWTTGTVFPCEGGITAR